MAYSEKTKIANTAGAIINPLTNDELRASPIPVQGVRPNNGSALAAGNTHLTVGGSDGTNLRPLIVDSSGRLSVVTTPTSQFTYDPPVDVAASTVRTAAGSVDDQIILMRRILKILESQSAVDSANRQRLTLDSITAGVTLPTVTTVGTVSTVTAVTTVSTVTTVAAVTAITNALPSGTNNIGYIGMLGDTRIDMTRNTYANALRNRLTFS